MEELMRIGLPVLLLVLVFVVLPFLVGMLWKSTRIQQVAAQRQQDGLSQASHSMQRQEEALALARENTERLRESEARAIETVQLMRENVEIQRAILAELRQLRQSLAQGTGVAAED